MKIITQKIRMFALALGTWMLSNQVNAATGVTQKVLQPMIQKQCQQELNQSKAWQVSVMFMAAAKKQKAQQSICHCVSEHAMDQVSAQELMAAGLSEDAKAKLTKRMVVNSVKGCAEDILH